MKQFKFLLPFGFVILFIHSSYGCNNPADINITTNTTYNSATSIGGNINVKNGATLTVNANLELGQGKKIFVENGGKLIVQNNATLNKCPLVSSWGGINVKTGGELEIINAQIYNAVYGIVALENSEVYLDDIEITGINTNNGIGLELYFGVDALKINDLRISDINVGIYPRWGFATYEITNCTIDNVYTGIAVRECTVLVHDTEITNAELGINMWEASGSVFTDNEIGYSRTGILDLQSKFVLFDNNKIGWPYTQIGSTAINLRESEGWAISNNPYIRATKTGIESRNSNALISFNDITVADGSFGVGSAIKLTKSSNGFNIINNTIICDPCGMGINVTESNEINISNNSISFYSAATVRDPAIIKLFGSMGNFVQENEIYGYTFLNGIVAQNSSSNEFWCNATEYTLDGLGINFNSEEQNIKGNQFNDETDLRLRSAVGDQYHHGNLFFGGVVRADELDNFEVTTSIFTANENHPTISELWPSDILPSSGWFIHHGSLNHFTCDSIIGPGWEPFDGDSGKICDYWTYLKSLQSSSPKLFFIKIYHLLKYSKIKTGYSLPNCILQDSVFLNLCGLDELSDLSLEFDKIGRVTVDGSTLTGLQEDYVKESTDIGRASIKIDIETEVNSLLPDINASILQDSVLLDSIGNELDSIICTDSLVTIWKEVLLQYAKFLKNGEVAQNNEADLIEYSSYCSDLYGDAIHLARIMASTFDDTDFEEFDGCLIEEPRLSKTIDLMQNFNIYPNPTFGKLHLQMPLNYNGIVKIYTLDGKLMRNIEINDSNLQEIDVNDLNGIYTLQFFSNTGEITTKKFIVLK